MLPLPKYRRFPRIHVVLFLRDDLRHLEGISLEESMSDTPLQTKCLVGPFFGLTEGAGSLWRSIGIQ